MTLVRTTMQPDRVLDVDDAELLDLARMGLILEFVLPEPAPASTPALASTPPTPTPVPTPPSTPSTATNTATDRKEK